MRALRDMSDKMNELRHDWRVDQAKAIHEQPLFKLLDSARSVHARHHGEDEVQLCTLLSVKTGGCPENCAYCPQSAHYQTSVEREPMLDVVEVMTAARRARENGSTRFCMGAAWRQVKDGPEFDSVLEMVRGVKQLGLEACCTLGMLSPDQAARLKEAGLDAYNHNIDTSETHYKSVVTTRSQTERFRTLQAVRDAGITVCSGGIIGMGESIEDRCAMLVSLANLQPQPESVPINALVRVAGTPMENMPPIDPVEFVRMIATARIMLPQSRVRLSAGRSELSRETQLMCMYAGANSIFYGDKLLTTPNPETNEDLDLIGAAGLRPQAVPR